MEADLFTAAAEERREKDPSSVPLAVRMRPRTLDEVAGQRHLLRPGSPLRRLVAGRAGGPAGPASVILWGPPGTGKTTLASIVSNATDRRFTELSAISAGVREVRAVIEGARRAVGTHGRETVLFLDEIHRFSKAQQDSLLPAVENRWITLIAATTENPHFSVITPLLSRSLLLTLEPLTEEDLRELVRRAVAGERGLNGTVTLPEETERQLLRLAGGDARRALTALEAAAGATLEESGTEITPAVLERTVDRAAVAYDRDGDQHYDVASALIKSIRGSDADAALHWLARMVDAGEDPRFIARRLMIAASEDIGLAEPQALSTAVAAAQAVAMIGFPEARIILSQAVLALALAPKSNSAVVAIDEALGDVRAGRTGPVPAHLRDSHYAGARSLGHGAAYVYPHDLPGGIAAQQYAPDAARGRRYYRPGRHGAEARYAEVSERVRARLAGDGPTARSGGTEAPAVSGGGAEPVEGVTGHPGGGDDRTTDGGGEG
ncbi:replication-associated recombination protein A [Streptomyces sp. ST2-7A]|uniref:replication-associated recombination protein A n=1 Tax=Streptomyces sp. ST2-7A TaxID=2907214 RepID=UPI001F490609|nr:replication-associated recombination protein A [Streptomyces sp. ST2-7A]MCE7079714.1 replication-associated recombination protein A [Streptomyces sp. ST2-7A]